MPYADKYAWDTLTNILKHYYVWSENLGCYIAYMPLPAVQQPKGSGEDEGNGDEEGMEVDSVVEEEAECVAKTKGKGRASKREENTTGESVSAPVGRKRSRASIT